MQAEHQHMYDFTPIVFFIHLRATGDAVTIAKELHNVLRATSTPLPQAPPAHPTTPFDAKRLDLSFFELLARHAGVGKFGQAYIVGHELGHHFQQVTGV